MSPLRVGLGLDNHTDSPTVLLLIAKAAGGLPSAQAAAFALHLADLTISSRHVPRIANAMGGELIQQRDHQVIARRRRELPVRVANTPAGVAAQVEGGRLRTREADRGPGVHEEQNKEDKIACLVSLKSQVHESDPQPEPPPSFLEPRRGQRLMPQMKGSSADTPQAESHQEDASTPAAADAMPEERPGAPVKLVPTGVASRTDADNFGPMMAAAAPPRGFFDAQRKAFVADGAACNGTIQRGSFADFEPIGDLLHVLCYLYLAAAAVGDDDEDRWRTYVGWRRACWPGPVAAVIEELCVGQAHLKERMGEPPEAEELEAKDPRRLVAEALSYLKNNQSRRDSPRDRKQGLPITSRLGEALVGECNARVKSQQKSGNRPDGAEAIRPLHAAVLSEEERRERYCERRPGNPDRRRRVA